ncbi:hypothetical protein J004_06500 [Cryptococcus neoformans]|nr:hypothetical protein J004_06500 [Cryptococcus neoformans var. grubii]
MSHHFEHPLIDITEVTAGIKERCRKDFRAEGGEDWPQVPFDSQFPPLLIYYGVVASDSFSSLLDLTIGD